MRKFGFKLIVGAMALIMVAVAAAFATMLKTNLFLRGQLNDKQAELQKVEKASKRLQEIGKRFEELKSQEELLDRRMPSVEKMPLGLYKKLLGLAWKKGISRVAFQVTKEPAVKDPPWQGFVNGCTPAYVTVTGRATYSQFVEFLKEIIGMERVVMVERVSIGRDEKTLPYQNVTVSITSYSFDQ